MDIYNIILVALGVVITGLGIAVGKLNGGKKRIATILRILVIGSVEAVKGLQKMADEDPKIKKVLDKEKISPFIK